MSLTPDQLKATLEAAIFTADEPVSAERLIELFGDEKGITPKVIRDMLGHLQKDYHTHGIELVEVASGYRFQVKTDVFPSLGQWLQERPSKYSRALLETLALIAYKQPITRADIEQVRGVTVSTQTIKTLLEREWVKIAGHRDVPGKPALYATTKKFLDYFGLKSLTELPALLESREDEGAEQLLLSFETLANKPEEETQPASEEETQLGLEEETQPGLEEEIQLGLEEETQPAPEEETQLVMEE